MKNLTVCIKTMNRPKTLDETLKRVRLALPDSPIFVADDSTTPINVNPIADKYWILEPDSGVSYGRNYLIDRVQTPYFLIMDDDNFFTEETDIGRLLTIEKEYNVDIVTGVKYRKGEIKSANSRIEISDGVLKLFGFELSNSTESFPLYDFAPNFFVAQTNLREKIKWDEDFKFGGEHADFFLRASKLGISVSSCLSSRFIDQGNESVEPNTEYRNRSKYYRQVLFAKHGLTAKKRVDRNSLNDLIETIQKKGFDKIFT